MIIESSLYRLMTWLSPSYPIGGYSYSHGLEYAVEAGIVLDAPMLARWIEAILCWGTGKSDAAFFAAAYRAAVAGDHEKLERTATLAAAWRASSELALESAAQGAAFLSTTLKAWSHPKLSAFAAGRGGTTLPIAVAVACASHGVPLELAMPAYLHGFAANLVAAGVKLIPLGQTDGQRVMAIIETSVAEAAESALESDLDTIGTAIPIVDLCSMQHETQYTKLFRS